MSERQNNITCPSCRYSNYYDVSGLSEEDFDLKKIKCPVCQSRSTIKQWITNFIKINTPKEPDQKTKPDVTRTVSAKRSIKDVGEIKFVFLIAIGILLSHIIAGCVFIAGSALIVGKAVTDVNKFKNSKPADPPKTIDEMLKERIENGKEN